MVELAFSGLANGAVYGLVAIGIVLVIKTTGVVNFAQGELLALGAFAYAASAVAQVSPVLQLAAVVIVGVLVGLAFYVVTDWVLAKADHYMLLIGTLALSTMIVNVLVLRYGDAPQVVRPWVFGDATTTLFGATLSVHSIVTIVSGIAFTGAIVAALRFTRTGRAMRAVAENRRFAALDGVSVRWILAQSWIAGSVFCGLAGMLLAPTSSVYPELGQDVLFKGFVAATVGGFESVEGAMICGLALGLLETYSTVVFGGGRIIDVISFAILLVILLIRPSGLFGRTGIRRA